MFGIGNQPPFYNNGFWAGGTVPNPSTFNAAVTMKETLTINKTAESGGLETVWTAKRSTDASGQISVVNGTSAAARFDPIIQSTGANTSSSLPLGITAKTAGALDSGTVPMMTFNVLTGAGNAIATRTLYRWANNGTPVLDALPLNSGANLALSWGTQTGAAPTWTTSRSVGTRAVWYNSFAAGSASDYSTGVDVTNGILWDSLPVASSSYSRRVYGGNGTEILRLLGNAHFRTFGARTDFIRIATTTPVTFATATDHIVLTNMGTPSAVAVSLGNPVYAGQRVTIKDAKGDAAANNITITPSSGTIDGAATLVINTNYGKANLISDGTNWFTL